MSFLEQTFKKYNKLQVSDAAADRAPWGPGGHGGVGQGHLTQVNFLEIRELDQSLTSGRLQ